MPASCVNSEDRTEEKGFIIKHCCHRREKVKRGQLLKFQVLTSQAEDCSMSRSCSAEHVDFSCRMEVKKLKAELDETLCHKSDLGSPSASLIVSQ